MRTRTAPARMSLLAFIRENPGLRRAEIAQRTHRGANATSRLLYGLHMTGYIVPSGVGKCTTWAAVECPEPKAMQVYKAKPIAPHVAPMARVSSVFELGAAA